jgi:hypothetical protein
MAYRREVASGGEVPSAACEKRHGFAAERESSSSSPG